MSKSPIHTWNGGFIQVETDTQTPLKVKRLLKAKA